MTNRTGITNHHTMKKLFLLTYLIPFFAAAQEEVWDTYMAAYEKGPGSVILNMSIKAVAPIAKYPFVIVTGVTFKKCTQDGLPMDKSFDTLYRISDAIMKFVQNKTEFRHVGSFTYQCERLDYIYVKDTTGLRQGLQKVYETQLPGYAAYLNIKDDHTWKYYLEFLYPNELTLEFMRNQKVLMELQKAGDNFEKERLIDHVAYFRTEQDRECFIQFVISKNYKITVKEKTDQPENPFRVGFSRIDKLTLYPLSELTLELNRQAKLCKGDYDGWETVVVR